MAKLLHIQASPRAERSASIAVAEHFIQVYSAKHPNDEVETLNLWDTDLPEFNGAAIDAKYAILHGQSFSPEQEKAWQTVVSVAERFKGADKVLFSLPMWNFGIPYKLKHFFDVLTQPGLAFSFIPGEGYKGLITGRPVVAIYARGGDYSPGSGAEAFDLQSSYLRQILGFIGFTEIKEVFVEPTLASPTSRDEAVTAGNQKAAELAKAI